MKSNYRIMLPMELPEDAIRHRYEAWKQKIGLEFFEFLLQQKYPCVINIDEKEEDHYEWNFAGGHKMNPELGLHSQVVTITIEVSSVNIQRGIPFEMYEAPSMSYKVKEPKFIDKVKSWIKRELA